MFISDKVIFLQLDKTASTHIAKLLNEVTPGEFRAKHSRLTQEPGGRCVIGSVRDPWDWYVSLWAYGCAGEGKVRRQLTAPFPKAAFRVLKRAARDPGRWGGAASRVAAFARSDPAEWRRLYASSEDPGLFREWLRRILSDEGKHLLTGIWEYPARPMRPFTGILTYRFLRLFVEAGAWRREAGRLRSPDEAAALYRGHANADRFVRMEHLGEDLAAILDDLRIPYDPARVLSRKRTNPSERGEAAKYYDAETIELVRRQDRLLVSEFGYRPPAA